MQKYLMLFAAFLSFQNWTFSQEQKIDYSNDTIFVYVLMLEDCVICQNYTLALKELHKTYASDKLRFTGLFPNKFSNRKKIAAYKEKYEIPFELKMDYFKTRTKKMGAKVTPTVAVYNQTKDEILYRGRIDNTYFRVGKRRTITTTSELADALLAISENRAITVKETEAVGCLINFRM